jgi:hypothetical protein
MTAKKTDKSADTSNNTDPGEVEDPRGRAAFVRERHGEGGPHVREGGHAADDIHFPKEDEA